ncbi:MULTISPECIES: NADH-quinone oxidoreductase subunit C [unclassified Saccharopolyspora]|uniref:NADH-quinone oxidoreductase subunit C n=1 Tax=unclassified Saccharopolyspora TaxID=2646250 RepID=UPI001CD31A3C|nr:MULTISPECIES: NADH-quinone oxidoreductase subunit C [unclassified Saccharopolyspora]MCA1187722.1 NADH-quinone oxidoreductase subunit C [Saccharopolyspora sp. 6T]MCA1278685.1 NADH-quinone oxidoreductase subunit C [Saccharopolyspora sp. 7B]
MTDSKRTTPDPGEKGSSADRPGEGLEPVRSGSGAIAEPREPIVAGRERQGMFGVRGSGDTSGYGGLRLPAHLPAPAERPFGGWFDEVADALLDSLRGKGIDSAVQQVTVDRGEITFYVDREHLVSTCSSLRDDPALRFELCSSVSGVDYGPEVPQRLHSVYHLTSMTYRRRIRLEVAVDVDDPHLPSVVSVYPTADFQEREAWDMFGLVYDGHPALTRILMPDDWDGHPQRKDYPLGGIPVEYKGAEIPPPDQRRAYS